ncbi:MAG: IS1595 family transposase [Candidatus Korobacteraceae bacterium]
MSRRQTIPQHLRYTIDQFRAEFPNDDTCLETIKEQRYPGGVTFCSDCGEDRKLYRIAGRPAYSCERGHHFYPLAGTIFEKSTTALHIWFYAMYQMGSTRCGISAKQIQRETGVTYKTAWRIFRQIRSLLSETDMQLEGSTVEMDESYFGAKRKRGEKKGRPAQGSRKQCVVGVVERTGKGRVIAVTSDNATKETLHGIAKEFVLPKSTVFTDEYASYNGLDRAGYEHRRINHSEGVYVMGDVHTNTIEGFWSLVKRGIGGVYHNVGKHYLQTYLNEYSFRYNRRESGNLIFHAILERVSGQKACVKPSAPVAKTLPV